jgi:hypothetical protein
MGFQRDSVESAVQGFERHVKRAQISVGVILAYLALWVFAGMYFVGRLALEGGLKPTKGLFGIIVILLGIFALALWVLYSFLFWRLFRGYRGLKRANPLASLHQTEQTLGILLGFHLLPILSPSVVGILMSAPFLGVIGFAIFSTRQARQLLAVL